MWWVLVNHGAAPHARVPRHGVLGDDVYYYNCQRLKLEGETENRWDEGVDEMRERYVRLEEREG